VKNHLLISAAASLAFCTTAFAQTASPSAKQDDTLHSYVLYPKGSVLGLDVMNESQKNVGEIGDLLVDPRTGEIRYAVLDVGGFLGLGEDHRVVPWSLIQIVSDEKDPSKPHASTAMTEAQIKGAPKIKAKEWVAADLDKRIESSFGKDESWAYNGKGEPAFAWISALDGVVVRDSANQDVGKVQDLVLAPSNDCVAYVVIDTNKAAGGKHVALPFSRVQYSYDADRKLVGTTPVEIAKFTGAPEYDSKDWKRMSSTAWMTEISTYYGGDPFWKTPRFASSRKTAPVQHP